MTGRQKMFVLAATLALFGAQGLVRAQRNDTRPAPGPLSDEEFRDIARSFSSDVLDAEYVTAVLRRASVQQGSNLILAVSLPRASGREEVVGIFLRIWEGEATDIPISMDPIFQLSVASALYRLRPEQCSGCADYARGLLAADDGEVRSAAALAMATLGSPDDIPTLRRLIVLDDFAVAASAAASLTGIQEADSVPMLQELLNDPALSAEKRDLITQVLAGVQRREAIRESLRAQ